MSNLRTSRLIIALALAALLSVAAAGDAHACFNAYHARRIVLGASKGEVVILELDWRRDQDTEKALRWRGPVRVGLLAGAGKLRDVRELGEVTITPHGDDELERAIKQQMSAGLVAARSYPGFQPAGMPRHQACDFEASCDRIRLDFDRAKGAFLRIASKGAPQKVPLPIPKNSFDDFDSVSTKEEMAPSLSLVSLLSYDVAGHEVLVVDFGSGDNSVGEQGLWPPCGCQQVSDCPPLSTTMHHGTQFEVVVPLSTPRPALAAAAVSGPKVARLDASELSRAEGEPKMALRTDGIYASDPSCRAGTGWSRRFFRFFPDGTVRQVDGNLTPKQAYRDSAKDSHWALPAGTLVAVGRRISAVILDDEQYEPRGKWTLDGILDKNRLRAMSASADSGIEPMGFRFTRVK